jgi:hypothetical protein
VIDFTFLTGTGLEFLLSDRCVSAVGHTSVVSAEMAWFDFPIYLAALCSVESFAASTGGALL